VNISSHRSFNRAFTCMAATQGSRRLLETIHELVCSQMASLYDSDIEFSCQLEILN